MDLWQNTQRDGARAFTWTVAFGILVTFLLSFQVCHGGPTGTGTEDDGTTDISEGNISTAESIYQRKYYINIPKAVVCFPGFDDRLLELENQTLLQDIYNLKLFRPSDLVLLASNVNFFTVPVYASLRILYVLARYADTKWVPDFTAKLVDAKIESAIARLQIGSIKAKIETINSRLSTVLNDKQPLDVRKTDLAVATDKSEEILILFDDKDIIFKNYPAASMPFLMLFSGPYNVLLGVASALIPSKIEYYQKQLQKLNDTVEFYKSKTLTARLDNILYDKVKKYPDAVTILKNSWNYRVLSYDYDIQLTDPQGISVSCRPYKTAETYNQTEAEGLQFQFLDEYKNNITKKYDDFFSAPSQVFALQDCNKTCAEASGAPYVVESSFIIISALMYSGSVYYA